MAQEQGWTDYWKENMADIGIKPPDSYYATQVMITGAISTILATAKLFGPRVTVAELAGAGASAELAGYAGALSASYLVGAMIGSGAVATQRSLMKGTTLGDVIFYATHRGWNSPGLTKTLANNPKFYSSRLASPYGFILGHVR